MLRSIALLAAIAATVSAQGPFDKKLTGDRRIQHALNRLTFGARPGDMEAIKVLGLEKWIQAQLHPDAIKENPDLAAKLKPLDTLNLDIATILKEYPITTMRPIMRPSPNELIGGSDAYNRFAQGTTEERMAILKPLDPVKRRQFLALLAPAIIGNDPELKKEAAAARDQDQKDRNEEFRRMMPPLTDLLNQDQMQTAMRGNKDQLKELFEYLEPAKRAQVAAMLPPNAVADFPEYRRAGMKQRSPQQLVVDDLKQSKILRAIYSERQLEEELVDFWFNHFNVYENKQNVRSLIGSFERDAIRPHVFGKFKDLLLATARHPAMLFYLDNWESMSPDVFSVGPFAPQMNNIVVNLQRQAHGINENYGREIMELHTLGVKGGYTQEDVIAVAKCFTGWTVRDPSTTATFVFAPFMHDFGEKTLLGHKLPAGRGEQDGLDVIDILAHHPSTARFISRKLAVRFVADNPPQALIDRMAATFTKTDGDLRAVVETMISSPEFFSEGAFQAKIKSPFEMVVSALRAMSADATDASSLAQKIADLGQPLYERVDPGGYPGTGEVWLNTATLFGRVNFAATLTSGQIAGVKLNASRLQGHTAVETAREILGADASPQMQEALAKGVEGMDLSPRYVAGLVMGSPDFQRR